MSGAGLETAGQIRNVLPYLVTESISVAPVYSATPAAASVAITTGKRLPFGIGPDKSGRVYPCINGVYVVVSADSYVGSPLAVGTLQWRDSATSYVLCALANALTAPIAINLPDVQIIPFNPYMADAINDLGRLEFVNIASALGGTATAITFTVYMNIGYYGDYDTGECCEHHSDMVMYLRQLSPFTD